MTYKNQQIFLLKPLKRIKYNKFCNKIYKKYHKNYISYENIKPFVNIHLLISILVEKLKPPINKNYVRNKKYSENECIKGILSIINNNTYWCRYEGKVPGKYLNKKHNDYCKWGVYECLYRILLISYFRINKFKKLHYQIIDSTFISNLYGKEIYGRNVKYKSKNGINLSFITDANGIPISIAINPGNQHDSTIAKKQLVNKFLIDTETKQVKNNNKYSQFLIGDAAYFNEDIYKILRKKYYKPLTDTNMRNTKDPIKRKKIINIKRKYKKNQYKRIIIEHCNSWVKKYPKMSRVVEKSINSFIGILFVVLSHIVSNKIE